MNRTFPDDLQDCIRAGFELIKVKPNEKVPQEINWQTASRSPEEIVRHVADGGNAGWRLGPIDLVMDVDPRDFRADDDPLARLCRDTRLNLADCPHVLTGSGGHHYYMIYLTRLHILDSLPDYPGIRFRTCGHQVLVPGSVHPSGRRYMWDDLAPSPGNRPHAPDTLLNLIRIRAPGKRAVKGNSVRMPTQVKLDRALELAQRGFFIFPVKVGTKNEPLTRWRKGGVGQCATNDQSIIRQWWRQWPTANIAIATGPSRLLVLDVDVKNGKKGKGAFFELDLIHGPIPRSLTVLTPSGGCHIYFRVEVPVGCRTNLLKDKIGEGLDIRSEGGYVVAPGSEIATGTYEYENPTVPIEVVPQELLHVINRERECVLTQGEPGSFSPEQLTEMLRHLDPTEFRDHDKWFQIMCACHHATQGEGGEEFVAWSTSDPMFCDHDENIRYRWGTLGEKTPQQGPMVTEATLIHHVREAGGTIPGDTAADDFESLPDLPGNSKRFLNLEEIKYLPPVTWLIKGIIPEQSLCILYGAPGTYKTFMALDFALCTANGKSCFDRSVRQGAVFYLAGESPAGFRLRIAAWENHHGHTIKNPPFYLQPGGAVLNREGEVDLLIKDILDISGSPSLIVVDTLQVYMEGNENSPEHMGAFVRACLQLRERTGAAVLVLHHVGKDTSKGARGHTSLAGTADAMFEMGKQGQLGLLRCTKMKEADDQFTITLQAIKVVVDPDGEFVDSLVLAESEQAFDTETATIHHLAAELNGKGLKALVEAVQRALNLSGSSARRKIKSAIPEGEEQAIEFEGGRLWMDPDPRNSQGGKTIRHQRDDPEGNVEDPDDSDDLSFLL